MPITRKLLCAGAAALALAGLSGAAAAQSPATPTHVMTISLPGGGTAQLRYTGDVPPTVVFAPAPAMVGGFASMPAFLAGPPPFAQLPFAQLDAIMAQMDREASAMLREARALAAAPVWMPGPGQLTEAGFGNLPPGTQGYSMVSVMSGNHVCNRTVTMTRDASGAPHVVSRSSGDCAGLGTQTSLPARQRVAPPAAPHRPGTILVEQRQPAFSGVTVPDHPPLRRLVYRVADGQS